MGFFSYHGIGGRCAMADWIAGYLSGSTGLAILCDLMSIHDVRSPTDVEPQSEGAGGWMAEGVAACSMMKSTTGRGSSRPWGWCPAPGLRITSIVPPSFR